MIIVNLHMYVFRHRPGHTKFVISIYFQYAVTLPAISINDRRCIKCGFILFSIVYNNSIQICSISNIHIFAIIPNILYINHRFLITSQRELILPGKIN